MPAMVFFGLRNPGRGNDILHGGAARGRKGGLNLRGAVEYNRAIKDAQGDRAC